MPINNKDTTKKAIRVQIHLGDIPLHVYQLPDGEYKLAGRSVTQAIREHNKSLSQKMGVKSLKTLPHADLSLGDKKGRIKAETGESFIPVSIEDAVAYWVIMSNAGNTLAGSILGACAIEAIERRADKAFGKEVSDQERNFWFQLRQKRIMARKGWTDTLMHRNIQCYGTKPTSDQYRKWTGKINLALFSQWHFQCDRDTMTLDEQMEIEAFEFMAQKRARQYPHATPDQLVSLTLADWR